MNTKNFLSFTIVALFSVQIVQAMISLTVVGSGAGGEGAGTLAGTTVDGADIAHRGRTTSSLTAATAGIGSESDAASTTDTAPAGPSPDAKSVELFALVCADEKTCMTFLENLTVASLDKSTAEYGLKAVCSLVASPLFRSCLTISLKSTNGSARFMKNESETNRRVPVWNFSNPGFCVVRTVVETKDPSLLVYLHGTGLNPNVVAPDNKMTPLMQAAQEGLLDVMEAMLHKNVGADINFVHTGKTALDFVPQTTEMARIRAILCEKYGAKTGAEIRAEKELPAALGSLTV